MTKCTFNRRLRQKSFMARDLITRNASQSCPSKTEDHFFNPHHECTSDCESCFNNPLSIILPLIEKLSQQQFQQQLTAIPSRYSFIKENVQIQFRKMNSNVPKSPMMEYNFLSSKRRAFDSVNVHVLSKSSSIELQVKNLNPCNIRFSLLLKRTFTNLKQDTNLPAGGNCDDAKKGRCVDGSYTTSTQIYPRYSQQKLQDLNSDFIIIEPYKMIKITIQLDKLPILEPLSPGDRITFVSVITVLENMSEIKSAINSFRSKLVEARNLRTNHAIGANDTNGAILPQNDLLFFSETPQFKYLEPPQEMLIDNGLPIVGFG